jgi:sigma54-dependent transcription regulator
MEMMEMEENQSPQDAPRLFISPDQERSLLDLIKSELARSDAAWFASAFYSPGITNLLIYRLSILMFHIKPLRVRLEDVGPPCNHFIKSINEKYNMKKQISNVTIEELKRYSWPGNVRELKNVVKRMAILSSENNITAEDVRSII